MRKRNKTYRNVDPNADPKLEREQGQRRIITGKLIIDYSVFQKTPDEKLRLKIEKAKHKELLKEKSR